ncbi:unnamed protein product, partial [Meganyctiphanes norvegica]
MREAHVVAVPSKIDCKNHKNVQNSGIQSKIHIKNVWRVNVHINMNFCHGNRDCESPSNPTIRQVYFICNNCHIPEYPTEQSFKSENIEEIKKSFKKNQVVGKSFKTPAEQLKDKSVPIPYKEPKWSGLPVQEYMLEVMKNGIIVDNIKLDVPFMVVGRSAGAHIPMDHPSISRFHCVIQYRLEGSEEEPRGFYAYDLGSTHGSFQNKHRMKPHTYYHFRVGHILKLGGSTRMFVLQGPDIDQEPESELSATELMALAKKKQENMDNLKSEQTEVENEDRRNVKKGSNKNIKDSKEESDGINWGMAEDAVEEDEEEEYEGENPFAVLNEELYLDDPKKTLRGWFEREGYDLPNYEISDISNGHYKCKVDLPVEGHGGGPVIAQVEHKGKKKDAVIQCALEACRILDRKGVLRQAKHESREKKKKDWAENDYYDSDEDEFLDRTGDIEKKRIKRMKETSVVGQGEPEAETYQSLIIKYNKVVEELCDVENKLAEAERLKAMTEKRAEAEDVDVDDYMKKLKSQVPDKHKRVAWKFRMVELRKEEAKLRKLTNVARPLGIPELKIYNHLLDSVINVDPIKQKKITKLYKGPSSFESSRIPKVSLGVHKAFLEEEPEQKVRLSRLDDNTPMPESLPYKTNETPQLKDKKIPTKESKPILPEEVLKAQEKISEQLCKTDDAIEKPENKNKEKMLARLKANQQGLDKAAENEKHKEKEKSNGPEENLSLSKSSESTQSNIPNIYENVLGDTLKRTYEEVHSTTGHSEAVTSTSISQDVLKKNLASELEFKKARILGPTMPPLLTKKKEVKSPTPSSSRKSKKEFKYDGDKPEYSTWTPPVGQTGDGRTSLNDKLGY